MGREIRRVPKGWEHPKDNKGHYKPMHDFVYADRLREWIDGYLEWESGDDPVRAEHADMPYWEWSGPPPDPDYYRPGWTDEPTYYQIYENVTEGTPFSPVFETLDELKDWLVEQGYSEPAAEKFAETGYAFSFAMFIDKSGARRVIEGIEALGVVPEGEKTA